MDKEKIRGKVFGSFNRHSKWRGIIDYKSLIFLIVYVFGLWNITNIFSISMVYKLYILIIFTIPVGVFIFAYISEESVVDMLFNILKFCLRRKWYVYVLKENTNVMITHNPKCCNKHIENVNKT